MWQIKFGREAEKQMESIDRDAVVRINKYLRKKLVNNPTSFGKALSANLKGFWRYRIGDYRVICDIREKELVVLIVKIGHRSKVYED